MPHSNREASDASRRRRRRRNRADHGPPAGDNSWTFEAAEEETPTVDPSVDPSDKDCHGPKLPRDSKVCGAPQVCGSPKVSRPRSSPSQPSSSKPRAQQGDDQILSALRRLLRSDDPHDEEVASLAGPAKGIKWRGGSIPQPPTWNYDRDDLRAYQKFCKKIDIWKLQAKAYVSPKEMALMFYSSLKGDLEQELEHTPVEEFHCDDGVDKLLLALRKPFEQKLVYQKRKFLSDFEGIRRYPGELMRTYINRFRRTSTALNSVGIQIDKTYDSESMGARLLDRSGLTQDSQRLILVSSQQRLDFEIIAEALLLQFPDFRGAPPVAGRDGTTKGMSKGSSSSSSSSSPSIPSTRASSFSRSSASSGGKGNQRRQVWNAQTVDDEKQDNLDPIDEENYEEQDQQADDDQPQQEHDDEEEQEGSEDEMEISQLAQVLTLTAKRLSGVTLGRKFSQSGGSKPGSSKKKSPEELKKTTHCSACGALGHWAADAECPMNKSKPNLKPPLHRAGGKTSAPSPPSTGKSLQHQVSIVHHEHGNVEIQDNQDYGSLFHINMIQHISTITSNTYEVREVKSAEKFVGVMVLDSACQRTCCGKSWYRDHQQLLRSFGLMTREFDISEEFQFGKGTPTTSTTRAFLPSTIGEVPLLLGTAVLPESIPLLGSNQLLRRLGAVIDLYLHRVAFHNLVDDNGSIISVPLSVLGGQLTISITSLFKDEHMLSHPFWKRVSRSEVWHSPDPEVISEHLKVQEPIENNSKTLPADSDVPATTTMARLLEEVDHGSQDLHEEFDLPHDDGHQSQAHGQRMPSNASPALGSSGHHSQLPTRAMQEIRQCTRPVCHMSEVRPGVEVERRGKWMGSSWTGKILSTIATLASTILINDPGFRTCAQEQGLSFSKAETFEEGTNQGENIHDPGVYSAMDGMGPSRSGHVSSQRSSVQRGLPDHGAKVTSGETTKGLDGSCISDRASVPGSKERPGTRGQRKSQSEVDRVGLHRSGGRRAVQLGPGVSKRLRGQWKKSAKTLEFECMINEKVGKTVKDRPPPNIDLMEMFAGAARLTSMASDFNLNATQPFDLIYGMDFKDETQRSSIFRIVRKLRPWLIPMGVTCTYWSLFNINMNYNTDERKEILRFLQADDEVLVDFGGFSMGTD